MQVNLFSKEQLLKGYFNRNKNDETLNKIFFASLAYHRVHVVHEDLLYDMECYYFCEMGYMVERGMLSGALELGRNELSLYDLEV